MYMLWEVYRLFSQPNTYQYIKGHTLKESDGSEFFIAFRDLVLLVYIAISPNIFTPIGELRCNCIIGLP